jgi:acyl-CoA thioesterase
MEMTVRSDMVNGVDVCHGGIIFTLADTAMALAVNSHNERALAAHAEIDWLSPVPLGANLTATATHVVRRGRSAVNDVSVVDETGTLVATFRGRTRSVGCTIIPDEAITPPG